MKKQGHNPIEKAIRIIAAASLRSTGDEIEILNTIPLAFLEAEGAIKAVVTEPPEPVSLVVNYEYDLVVKKVGKIDTASFQSFREDIERLGLNLTEVMTALTLAAVACR